MWDTRLKVALIFASLVSEGCARASVTQVQTPEGPGYELRCTEREDCFMKADELCESGYKTLSEGNIGTLYAVCANGNDLEVQCTAGKSECQDSAYHQCASSYEERNYYEKARVIVRCGSS